MKATSNSGKIRLAYREGSNYRRRVFELAKKGWIENRDGLMRRQPCKGEKSRIEQLLRVQWLLHTHVRSGIKGDKSGKIIETLFSKTLPGGQGDIVKDISFCLCFVTGQ